MLAKAQQPLGDFQVPVGDQQLPVRGTILVVRKLGDSTAAVVTFEGTKLPLLLFYHCVVRYVRPYKKTLTAWARCGTIGHRPHVCPHPNSDRCVKCGTLAPEGLTKHDCHPKCLLATVLTRSELEGARESTGSSRSPRHLEGLRHHSMTRVYLPGTARLPVSGRHSPLVASTASPQVSSWAARGCCSHASPSLPGCPSFLELAALRKQNADLQRQIALLIMQVASL
ncbi:hypothetical protein HPB50_004277 [Hyalomma asiaticum]|uniref:Uncharacterized protein n=1 Tax=Hyalomma asiaticum TaxID=266040 RepID=A0ACB7TBW1_HYAAI|nr:hypothetical protein HPB50_004277 [Hyalomma asiaticum]